MKKLIILFSLIILSACKSEKHIYDNDKFKDIQELKIGKAIEFENNQNAENTTPEYKVQIGKGIYPNEKNFELEKPISFNRKIKGKFDLETKYFYSKKDSLVRVILYQWHNPKDLNNKLKKNKTKNKKKFQNKFNSIEKQITKIIGQPNWVELNKDQFPFTRDERKWLESNKTKAYLFKGNYDPDGSYHIELAIYAE